MTKFYIACILLDPTSNTPYQKLMEIMRKESWMGDWEKILEERKGIERKDQESVVTWEGYPAQISFQDDWDCLLNDFLILENKNF